MIRQIQKLLEPIQIRVMSLVARGLVRGVDNSGGIQRMQVQVSANTLLAAIDHLQQYGFTSVPKAGSQCVVVFVGGNREQGIVIATDDGRTRPKVAEGETALWTAEGMKLVLKAGKKLEIDNGTHELVAVLSELIQAIIDARVVTAIGPQPLLNPANPFATVKAKLDTFKV